MCGKFSQLYSWEEVVAFSDFGREREDGETRREKNDREETFTPMRSPRIVRLNEAGERENVPMRWGWPDLWAPVPVPVNRPKHMHARAETIDKLRTFAPSFAERRGILPVETFNVGEEVAKRVIQHVLTPRDGKPLGIGVIWNDVPGP